MPSGNACFISEVKMIKGFRYFSRFEKILWSLSIILITIAFIISKGSIWTTFVSSVIGVTALVFMAKGNVTGLFLSVIFSIFYGITSFFFKYYGEMITYLCMTTPISIISIITWLKNPYSRMQVKVGSIKVKEYIFAFALSGVVSVIFYFILGALNTSNLIFSTISVFTSFLACYLSVRRSEFFALAYASNDIILIILWVLATISDISYLPMIICFVVFFINDIYSFINWSKMKIMQEK